MGIIYKRYLDGHNRVFGCSACRTHIVTYDALMSKAFQGHHGRAWLFHDHGVVNVIEGEPQERPMTTGNHVVCDIYCTSCQAVLGWKYEKAQEDDQKYKEGKFILERTLLIEVAA